MPIELDLGLERILAVRMDNIGDVVMLGPALRAIQAAYPAAQITLLASPGGSHVAPLLPWVSATIPWRAVWQDVSGAIAGATTQDLERELSLASELRRRDFQAAFIFTSFSQSPYPPAYVCYLAGIPVRVGHSREFGGSLLTHWFQPPADAGHQVERNLALVEAAGLAVKDRGLELQVPLEARIRADMLLQEGGVDPAEPFLVLAPGASCSTRRYPPERFAQVGHLLMEEAGLPVVLVGSQREAAVIAPVIEALQDCPPGRALSLVGETTVPEFAGVIRRSALVVANNSAALHIADAFRRPEVVLYSGSETITQWEPRSSKAKILHRETGCSPCYRFDCPYHLECLDIAPEEVVEAALQLLEPDPGVEALRV